jgi:hypothetical protein
MVVVPSATEVTSPVAETVAIAGALDDQVMGRPFWTMLFASLVSAVT